jgi:hypothetical protein
MIGEKQENLSRHGTQRTHPQNLGRRMAGKRMKTASKDLTPVRNARFDPEPWANIILFPSFCQQSGRLRGPDQGKSSQIKANPTSGAILVRFPSIRLPKLRRPTSLANEWLADE